MGRYTAGEGLGKNYPRNTIPTVKGSTDKVNIWGVILYHGVRRLHHVIGNMDSEQLEGILEDSLLHSFDDRRTDPTCFMPWIMIQNTHPDKFRGGFGQMASNYLIGQLIHPI